MAKAAQTPINKTISGKLAVIGGRLETDNQAVFLRLKEMTGGRIAIFPTASGEWAESAADTASAFQAYGFDCLVVPLHSDNRAVAFDPAWIAQVQAYRHVYFTGGDQFLIVSALKPDGRETPMLAAIRACHAAGGVVAGSSAGAAMMSDPIILSGTSLDALSFGRIDDESKPGLAMGPGLGFFPHGLVDQHFIRRGRLGRLLVGLAESGLRYGFGIDENSAMIVDGGLIEIIGEYGAFVLDLSKAKIDLASYQFSQIGFSYLDHGDFYDLVKHQAIPGPGKVKARPKGSAYVAPANLRRNIFGSYALYEMMVRLVNGDPQRYCRDQGQSYDPRSETEIVLSLERVPRRSKALIAHVGDQTRYSAFDFRLDIACHRLTLEERRERLHRDARRLLHDKPVAAGAQIIFMGSSLLAKDCQLADRLPDLVDGPVAVVAAASSEPGKAGRDYVGLCQGKGLLAVDLGISAHHPLQRLADPNLVEAVQTAPTILFTGGNQLRLVDTLLYRGEETPALRAMVHCYRRGGSLIAVSGAASAFSTVMIAGGDSRDALLYGISGDPQHAGLMLEEGFGLFDLGIVDQNLIARNRLGRLIVACAEEGQRFGFGLCEESALLTLGPDQPVQAIGLQGVLVADFREATSLVQSDSFAARNVRLTLLRDGDCFDPETGLVKPSRQARPAVAEALTLTEVVERFAASLRLKVEPRAGNPDLSGLGIHLAFAAESPLTGRIDLASRREDC